MNYKTFDVWQFVEDKYFVDWVLSPDIHSRKFWESFLSEHPEKVQDVLLAKEIITGMSYEVSPELDDAGYVSLFERILTSKRKMSFARTKARSAVKPMMVYKYAAAVVFVVSVTGLWLWLHPSPMPATVELKTVECPMGSHINTLLSDGTKVKLNSGSKISFKESFEDDTIRIVYLDGEAFFEVTENPEKPFIVKSNFMDTRVLGTRFNVSAYHEDEQMSVAVAEGKVRVNSTAKVKDGFEYDLLPMQASYYYVNTDKSEKRRLNDRDIFEWMNWKLVCNDDTLSEILIKLERWYGVQFQVEGNVNMEETFTGVFENQSLAFILEAFKSQQALDFKVLEDKKILIYN